MWAIPLKNKNSETLTNEFWNILTTSEQSPLKIESDRGAQFYNSIFQNFLKPKKIQHYSRFRDKGPSMAEAVIRTIRNLFKKPIFLAGNADWLSELPSIIKKHNNKIHNSTKMTTIQASKISNEKLVYSNLRDDGEIQTRNFKLGQLNRTADIKQVFSKGDSTNYSHKLYTLTQIIRDTVPSYQLDYLHERYNPNLSVPTKISLDENNKVMKELNSIQ